MTNEGVGWIDGSHGMAIDGSRVHILDSPLRKSNVLHFLDEFERELHQEPGGASNMGEGWAGGSLKGCDLISNLQKPGLLSRDIGCESVRGGRRRAGRRWSFRRGRRSRRAFAASTEKKHHRRKTQ